MFGTLKLIEKTNKKIKEIFTQNRFLIKSNLVLCYNLKTNNRILIIDLITFH